MTDLRNVRLSRGATQLNFPAKSALGPSTGLMRHTHARKVIMTSPFVDSAVRLKAGELLDINDGEGFAIECLEGAVWITQSNDPRDIVLRSGESFVLDKPGLALVCAADGPATVAVAVSLRLLPRARSRLRNSARIRLAA
jgi:hypothetical protein